jgi:hypothetical protein
MRRLALCWIAVLAAAAIATAQSPLAVRGVPDDAPFAVTARATAARLTVELVLGSDWHAYSRDVGGGQPVGIEIDPDSGFAAAGALRACGEIDGTGSPLSAGGRLRGHAGSGKPIVSHSLGAADDGQGKLVGRVLLTLPLAASRSAERLRATLQLQVCDALQCLEPMTLEIEGPVGPLSVLLVAAARDARTGRIAGWLRGRGFAVTIDTYAEVSAEACEAHDLVIADSDVFRKHGVGLDLVHRFPRTSAPLLAVGFLGTELVEAHGVAMTSGYI